ncbi:hypothetical protein Golomagni_07249 [Golovinomyces magnicellulatus]|nr:hypothetical protein Golomagni_07249 [Golovinomyces magnicellulatus]
MMGHLHCIGKNVDFEGVRLRVSTEKPAADAFQHIAAGQSVEVTFDVAQSHNLSSGGKFDVVADGILQFASDADTALVGSVPYTSNTLSVDVDGAEASTVREAMQSKHTKRTNIVSCSSSRLSVTRDALSYCVSLSRNAASAATSGSASKMNEFFKDSSSQTRSYVASVFNAVARECGSTSGGYSDYYCYDVSGYCESNVLAYTVPSQSYMAYCDLYYNQLPTLTSSCHRQDKATTNLHEMTHLTQIAGTDDLGYGYDNIRRLSSRDSLNNADSYAVFANSIYAGYRFNIPMELAE